MPDPIIAAYYALLRAPVPAWVPEQMRRQAVLFVDRGFTVADLECVIRYIERQIRRAESGERNTGGYNRASLQWGVLFGSIGDPNDFQKFVDRLALARADEPKAAAPRPVNVLPMSGSLDGLAAEAERRIREGLG